MPERSIPLTPGSAFLPRLQKALGVHRIEGLILTHLPNLTYLFGFTGSTGLALVTQGESFLFVDSRYTLQAKEETVACSAEAAAPSLEDALAQKIMKLGLHRVGIESSHVSYSAYRLFQSKLSRRCQITPTSGIVEEFRMVKTLEEIEEIQSALNLTCRALDDIIPAVKPGIRERDLAAELEYQLRKRGARKTSFDTIVASGRRSAMPHGLASNKILRRNEFIVIDFGAYRGAYASDMTRTLFLGKPSAEQKRIYATVLQAVTQAEDRIRAGLQGKTVDWFARNHIDRSGFGAFFGHGTGHGIGLEVHEAPFINPRQRRRIRSNMVFTVEPGVYVPDQGGVRIEDIVRVTRSGCEVMTRYTKDLIVL